MTATPLDAPIRKASPLILVVDDDQNLLSNLAAFLENNGYTTLCAESALMARSLLESETVAGVVTDYRLGQESGVDLIQDIRREDHHTPIVLMSAYLDEWVEHLAGSFPRVTCVRKPFRGSEVLGAIAGGLSEDSA